MAENPLLPDVELRQLHALLLRCLSLDSALHRKRSGTRTAARRSSFRPAVHREALLAGTTIHLRLGDIVVGENGDTTTCALGPIPESPLTIPGSPLPALTQAASRTLLAVAMAAALKRAGTEGLVLFNTQAGVLDPQRTAALAWAQEQQLPFLLSCADPGGANTFTPSGTRAADVLGWTSLQQVAARLKLPILSVDGEDAVAVYRVMQESVLRARSGGGPAVLWAMLPSLKDLTVRRTSSQRPRSRLEHYLKVRKIVL